jgi:hypothetical protein
VKLFQIEEPGGGPVDPEIPGAAIGIDAGGTEAEIAFAVGGNAVVVTDRPGFERRLSVPNATAGRERWQELFEGARLRAERALSRPVDHAVVVIAATGEADLAKVRDGAEAAGLKLLRVVGRRELPGGTAAALTAAMIAEDVAPRPK